MKYTIMKYLRLSAEDVDLDGLDKFESNSITHQRILLDDFISKVPEFDNCEILEAIDDGRSGTNFNRPGIEKLLHLAEHGKIHCIIVKDLSRFGRNYLQVGDYLEQIFPKWGVRFISVNDMYDSADYNGTTGGINIAFRNLIAEMYSQDLSEKVKSAQASVNKSGKTSAPYGFYGYIKDPNDRHKLIIDEPAAEIVRLIFNLREQGFTTPKIARKLNGDGIQTASERKKEQGAKRDWLRRSKERMWETGFITRILSDERYTGKHIYGKTRRIEMCKCNVVSTPPSDWIVVPGVIPAIISDEQFRRVRELMAENTRAKVIKSNAPKPLLYRKVFCGACGQALTRSISSGRYIYCCGTPAYMNGLGCMRGSIRESDVIQTVLAVIRRQADLADSIKCKMAKEKSPLAEISGLRGEMKNLKKLVGKVNAAKLSLWEKQHMGDISLEAYRREVNKVTSQAADYAQKIAELEKQIRRLEVESEQENVFVERFSRQTGISELSREAVEEFVQAIHVYSRERIEVVLNYADEYLSISGEIGG